MSNEKKFEQGKKFLSRSLSEEAEIFNFDEDISQISARPVSTPIATNTPAFRQVNNTNTVVNPLSRSSLPEIKEEVVLEDSDYDSPEEAFVGSENELPNKFSKDKEVPSIAKSKEIEGDDDIFRDEDSIFLGEGSSISEKHYESDFSDRSSEISEEEDEKDSGSQKLGASPAITIKFKRPQDPENPYGNFTPFPAWQEKIGKGNGWQEIIPKAISKSVPLKHTRPLHNDSSAPGTESGISNGSPVRKTSFPKGEYQLPNRKDYIEAKSPTMRTNSPLASLGDDESAFKDLQERAKRKISSSSSSTYEETSSEEKNQNVFSKSINREGGSSRRY
ncbi:MAG: hypothetical protein K0R98_103 [Rickettsiaceae bacterium]|jgi:hypothetical protein|nr:hypothetical protein [Rickettsiaceae bacterium]